jgi:hypothetical protein
MMTKVVKLVVKLMTPPMRLMMTKVVKLVKLMTPPMRLMMTKVVKLVKAVKAVKVKLL